MVNSDKHGKIFGPKCVENIRTKTTYHYPGSDKSCKCAYLSGNIRYVGNCQCLRKMHKTSRHGSDLTGENCTCLSTIVSNNFPECKEFVNAA